MKVAFGLVAMLAVASAKDDTLGKDRKDRMREMRAVKADGIFQNDMYERHERRIQKLEGMLEDRKASLEAHQSGRKLMEDADLERVTRQVTNFAKKIDQMKNMDETQRRELAKHQEEVYRSMKESDYIDFNVNKGPK